MGDLERFLSKTKRDPESGCLLWVAGRKSKRQGYGAFKTRDGTSWFAHRWIFREMYGYLPEVVMHRCDTPACVDWVNCLRAGTHAENQKDKAQKGRGATGELNGKASLTDLEAVEIYEAYWTGPLTLQALADAYGCGKSTVSRIVNCKDRFAQLQDLAEQGVQ